VALVQVCGPLILGRILEDTFVKGFEVGVGDFIVSRQSIRKRGFFPQGWVQWNQRPEVVSNDQIPILNSLALSLNLFKDRADKPAGVAYYDPKKGTRAYLGLVSTFEMNGFILGTLLRVVQDRLLTD
jgi:hypothetical protein